MNRKIVIGILSAAVLTGIMFKFSSKQPSVKGENTQQTATLSLKAKTFALKDVAIHKDASNCWSIINGKVYDLTSYVNMHPGGANRILSICGADGSYAFNTKHGGQRRPENELTKYLIGNLVTKS